MRFRDKEVHEVQGMKGIRRPSLTSLRFFFNVSTFHTDLATGTAVHLKMYAFTSEVPILTGCRDTACCTRRAKAREEQFCVEEAVKFIPERSV